LADQASSEPLFDQIIPAIFPFFYGSLIFSEAGSSLPLFAQPGESPRMKPVIAYRRNSSRYYARARTGSTRATKRSSLSRNKSAIDRSFYSSRRKTYA
jgi:hypothetical protein